MSSAARRVLKTRFFVRWMKKTELTDAALLEAVGEMEKGLIDAVLGGNLFKKRVALPGRGKRGSVRTLIATNLGNRWYFTDGFEKKEKGNLEDDELKAAKDLAQDLLALDAKAIEKLIALKELEEIHP